MKESGYHVRLFRTVPYNESVFDILLALKIIRNASLTIVGQNFKRGY